MSRFPTIRYMPDGALIISLLEKHMNIPTPAATRKKYELLLRNGGGIDQMEPLEQVILKFQPLSTWKFLMFSRSLKKIILLYLSQPETPEMIQMVANFVGSHAEPNRRQELANLMGRAIDQAKNTER